jgi:hypothetical protein
MNGGPKYNHKYPQNPFSRSNVKMRQNTISTERIIIKNLPQWKSVAGSKSQETKKLCAKPRGILLRR